MMLQSLLTCPHCGHAEEMTMPTDACLFFHECSQCDMRMRPKAGDCCVFCSYATVPCPPMQNKSGECCQSAGTLESTPLQDIE
jgi:hypothetical protein